MQQFENIEIETTDSASVNAQRIKLLLGTRTGELAGNRDFGIDWACVDAPMDIAKAALSNEILEKVLKYAPDATVTKIEWTRDATNGSITPKVVIQFV